MPGPTRRGGAGRWELAMVDRHGLGSTAAGGDEVGLLEATGILVRRWPVVVGTAVAAGLATALVVLASTPRIWESTATLVVSPPAFASELSPKALPLQTYQKLLESSSMIAETQARLVESGVLRDEQRLRRGQELEARIFVSRKSEETTLAPMVLAIARGATPRQAAEIANTWADVFLNNLREIAASTTSPTVELVDRQYNEAAAAMTAIEARRLDAATSLNRGYDEIADRWDREAARGRADAAAAVAGHRAETARVLEEYESTHGLKTRRAQVEALRQSAAELQGDQARVSARRSQVQLELEAARAALATAPMLVEVRKAITDDALWQAALTAKDPAAASAVAGRSLVSQEISPLHSELAVAAARLEIELSALLPRSEGLARLIEEAIAALREREIALAGDDAGLTALRENREAGLTALSERLATEAAVLGREQARELAAIGGARSNALAAVDRELATHKELLGSLSRVQSQTALARAQSSIASVRLALPAIAPHAPEPRGVAARSAAGTVVGALAGLLLALAVEARARAVRAEGA